MLLLALPPDRGFQPRSVCTARTACWLVFNERALLISSTRTCTLLPGWTRDDHPKGSSGGPT